jgi:hypothetical protein
VRTRQRAKVGAIVGDDRVDLFGQRDVADGDRRNADLVLDELGEWRLPHATVDGLLPAHGLT